MLHFFGQVILKFVPLVIHSYPYPTKGDSIDVFHHVVIKIRQLLFASLVVSLTPEINNQSKSIFTHPSLQFQSKSVFECANNVSTLLVVTYNMVN
jgi:hypothetical protein